MVAKILLEGFIHLRLRQSVFLGKGFEEMIGAMVAVDLAELGKVESSSE